MYVPRSNLQSNHYELVQDERGERNRNNIQKLVLEQDQRHDHNGRP